ncbi:hypothetical protein [Kitasatospora sp. NPDC057223]|uniref:hypothetical protein n=1 Tax=Kitasatospora sp. NPDC057223 TaxID=3346055 RepID=UPI00362C231F
MSQQNAALPAEQQQTVPAQAARPDGLSAEDAARFRTLLAGLESSLRADRDNG